MSMHTYMWVYMRQVCFQKKATGVQITVNFSYTKYSLVLSNIYSSKFVYSLEALKIKI